MSIGKKVNRLRSISIQSKTEHIDSVEELFLGDQSYEISFRETMEFYLPKTVLNKTRYLQQTKDTILQVPMGLGELILCPIPIELGHSEEGIQALYQFAVNRAEVKNRIFDLQEPCSESIVIYPMVYENTTVYTIVNEGYENQIHWRDLRSGADIKLQLPGQRGSKVWISKDGQLQGAYINGTLTVNNDTMELNHML